MYRIRHKLIEIMLHRTYNNYDQAYQALNSKIYTVPATLNIAGKEVEIESKRDLLERAYLEVKEMLPESAGVVQLLRTYLIGCNNGSLHGDLSNYLLKLKNYLHINK